MSTLPLNAASSVGEDHSLQRAGSDCAVPADWAALPVHARIRRVCALRHVLAKRADAFIEALRLPKHRTDTETVSGELIPLADACAFLERRADALLRPRRLGGAGRPLWLWGVDAEIHREPLGRVLIIGPGNYSLMLPGIQIVQALVAGNIVLFKPAPGTKSVAKLLCESLHALGVGREDLLLLDEDPAAAGQWFGRVDKVFMTASETSGKSVLQALAAHVVPAVMELSGCDATFVLPGADLGGVAAALKFGLTFNDSATCLAPRRVFVRSTMADELAERLSRSLRGCQTRSISPATICLLDQVGREAIESGAILLTGKLPVCPAGGPLIFDCARPDMRLLREDVMAPVLSIVRVDSDDQALAACELCNYCLGASVFGPELSARAFARRICAGSVVINDLIVPTVDPRLPFSPRKQSGFGSTRGAEGLLEMTRIKTVSVRRGRPAHLRPDAERAGPMLLAYLRAVHSSGLRGRLGAWMSLLREGRKLMKSDPRA